MNKIVKLALSGLVLLLLGLLLIPVLFKDKIIRQTINLLENNIHGQIDYSKTDISLLKNFPTLSVGFSDLKITQSEFEIFKTTNFSIRLDLIRLLKNKFNKIEIRDLVLDSPVLTLKVNKKGILNASELMKQKDQSSSDQNLSEFNINSIQIKDGFLSYFDSTNFTQFYSKGIYHSSNIRLSNNEIIVVHQSALDKVNFFLAGTQYLNRVKSKVDGTLKYKLDSSVYIFKENRIFLNDLGLNVNGTVHALSSTSYLSNIDINTPSNSLKDLISTLGNAYNHLFQDLTTDGTCTITASINGLSDSLGHLPFIKVSSSIVNGKLKYKSLPYSLDNINLSIDYQTLDSFGNSYLLDIPHYQLKLDQDQLTGFLKIKSYGTNNADIALRSVGSLDLNKLSKAIPMESNQLNGNLSINIEGNANQSSITHKDYGKIKLTGNATLKNLKIKWGTYPIIASPLIQFDVLPQIGKLYWNELNMGMSDFSGNIDIQNPLALMTNNFSKAPISAKLKSKFFNMDEWMSLESDSSELMGSSTETWVTKSHLNLEAEIDKIQFRDYNLKNLKSNLYYKSDSLSLLSSSMILNQSELNITGNLYNPYQWAQNNGVLSGTLNIGSGKFLMDPWVADSSKEEEANMFVKNLPERTDISINANIKSTLYNNYSLQDLAAKINLVNSNLEIENGVAKIFGGQANVSGVYNEFHANPEFNFKVDLIKLDISSFMVSYKVLHPLVPIVKYLEGQFSTSTISTGTLNYDLTPQWSSLDASGLFETFNGKLIKFKPLEDIANKLELPILKLIKLANTKNWFEILKGTATIQPLEFKYEDIKMTFQGSHQIDSTINYELMIAIPRVVLDKYKIGYAANAKFDWMRSQANQLGIQLQSLDTFYFKANINGPVNNLNTSLKLIQNPKKSLREELSEAAKKIIKDKVDSIQKDTEKKVDQQKDSILEIIKDKVDLKKRELDSLENIWRDSLKKVAEKKSKEIIDSIILKNSSKILDSMTQKKIDTLVGKKVKEEIEKINEKLKNWNPLKKPKQN